MGSGRMEYFRETKEFCGLLENFVTAEFLQEVCRKYHYDETEKAVLEAVARRMQRCMYEEAAYEQLEREHESAAVIMTLGAGVDVLQDTYAGEGLLSECYMIEALGSELLLRGYVAYNRLVREQSGEHVARYFFLGSDPDHSIEKLPALLEATELPVTCTEGFCMLPKKSVAFYAQFTEDESEQCEGICVGCGIENCSNRIDQYSQNEFCQTDMTDRPLTYGYARILGRKYL